MLANSKTSQISVGHIIQVINTLFKVKNKSKE